MTVRNSIKALRATNTHLLRAEGTHLLRATDTHLPAIFLVFQCVVSMFNLPKCLWHGNRNGIPRTTNRESVRDTKISVCIWACVKVWSFRETFCAVPHTHTCQGHIISQSLFGVFSFVCVCMCSKITFEIHARTQTVRYTYTYIHMHSSTRLCATSQSGRLMLWKYACGDLWRNRLQNSLANAKVLHKGKNVIYVCVVFACMKL